MRFRNPSFSSQEMSPDGTLRQWTLCKMPEGPYTLAHPSAAYLHSPAELVLGRTEHGELKLRTQGCDEAPGCSSHMTRLTFKSNSEHNFPQCVLHNDIRCCVTKNASHSPVVLDVWNILESIRLNRFCGGKFLRTCKILLTHIIFSYSKTISWFLAQLLLPGYLE